MTPALPSHLLAIIFSRLSVADFIRSGAVCKLWRQATVENPHRPLTPEIPYLFLPGGCENGDSGNLFNLTEQRVYNIPQIHGKQILGSSGGWLVITDEVAELQLLNPFTGATATLPSITTLSYIEEICYFAKVTYYPSASIAVVILDISGTLAFARLRDDSWTELKTPHYLHFKNFIFHKGQLFAVTGAGLVCVFDLGNVSPSSPPAISMFGPDSPTLNDHKHYLVESLDGDLLHVGRLTDGALTESFKIFKLEPSSLQRAQVKSLGAETALFLGHSHSMSISTRNLPLKGNCIYFTEDDMANFTARLHARLNMWVCDLEDGSIAPLFPSNSSLVRLTWPSPIWITPTLS